MEERGKPGYRKGMVWIHEPFSMEMAFIVQRMRSFHVPTIYVPAKISNENLCTEHPLPFADEPRGSLIITLWHEKLFPPIANGRRKVPFNSARITEGIGRLLLSRLAIFLLPFGRLCPCDWRFSIIRII